MQQSVEQRHTTSSSHPTLMWPSIGGMPLNELTTDGYFTCAFPTLFPTGAGDFLGQRQVPVTIKNYFIHLMQYDDGCFARHPRFRFFALNTEMLHGALQTGRVYVSSTQGMVTCPLWEGRERPSPSLCLQSAWHQAVLAMSTKSIVDHWYCAPFSSPTVQQTSNGLSWLNLSVLITLIPGLPIPRQLLRTWLLQAGSSTMHSLSSPRLSTLESLEPLTTG